MRSIGIFIGELIAAVLEMSFLNTLIAAFYILLIYFIGQVVGEPDPGNWNLETTKIGFISGIVTIGIAMIANIVYFFLKIFKHGPLYWR